VYKGIGIEQPSVMYCNIQSSNIKIDRDTPFLIISTADCPFVLMYSIWFKIKVPNVNMVNVKQKIKIPPPLKDEDFLPSGFLR
jgi:hypothetical protein